MCEVTLRSGFTYHADGECESCDCRDQIIRTNNRRHNTRWDHNPANTQTSNHQNRVNNRQIIQPRSGQSTTPRSHHNRRSDHERAITAAVNGQEPQDDEGTDQDSETDWHPAEPDLDRVVAVHVEGLGGPEEEDGEEVGAGDECDDECA